MRATLRLLAAVKPSRYLEAGNPTGLTGLNTHPSPRSYLLYIYGSILDRLKAFPESSVYRQSTEALTKHRVAILERYKPAGYEEWRKKATKIMEENPEAFSPRGRTYKVHKQGDSLFVQRPDEAEYDVDRVEWDGDRNIPALEGPRSPQVGRARAMRTSGHEPIEDESVAWEAEPPLEATQISEIENQIGAGLIEEVIQVAEGELKLVDTMMESRVWEELEEKPQPGQWEYFSRNQHMPGPEEPSNK